MLKTIPKFSLYTGLILCIITFSPSTYAANNKLYPQLQKTGLKQLFGLGMVKSTFKLGSESNISNRCTFMERSAFIAGKMVGNTKLGSSIIKSAVHGALEGAVEGFMHETHSPLNTPKYQEAKSKIPQEHGFSGFIKTHAKSAVESAIHQSYHPSYHSL